MYFSNLDSQEFMPQNISHCRWPLKARRIQRVLFSKINATYSDDKMLVRWQHELWITKKSICKFKSSSYQGTFSQRWKLEISLVHGHQSKFYVLGTGNEVFAAAVGKLWVKRLCLFSDVLPDCLWLFFALFCSCCARSWFSSPGGSSCSECFFLFKEDCSTRILDSATTNESFISAISWVSCSSGDDESTAKPRFRRQPNTGLGGGAHGNGDSLNTGGVCRNLAIPWRLP